MDLLTSQILISLAANYFTSFTAPVVEKFFKKVFQMKPELEKELQNANTSEEFEKVFKEAVGIIDAQAGQGSIEVDNSFLEAIRGIRFDHQDGSVSIDKSRIKAPILETGGTGRCQTQITESVLKSKGTQVSDGKR